MARVNGAPWPAVAVLPKYRCTNRPQLAGTGGAAAPARGARPGAASAAAPSSAALRRAHPRGRGPPWDSSTWDRSVLGFIGALLS